MYDFGFRPETLFGLALTKGYSHKLGDFYDADAPNKGNSFINGCDKNGDIIYTGEGGERIPDWLYLHDLHTDLRMFFLKCEDGKVVHKIKFATCAVKQMSDFSK